MRLHGGCPLHHAPCTHIHARRDGQQLLILPGKKQAQKSGAAGATAADAEQQPLSKSQLRKLKQIQLKKERRDNIVQVCLGVPQPHQVRQQVLPCL